MPPFKNKTQEKLYYQEILSRYNPDQRLNQQDFIDVLALLKKHTECKQKTGCGISDFSVTTATAGTKCFQIIRADGSRDHFSYLHCIRNKPKTKISEVRAAMREAVRKDIQEFKKKAFNGSDKIACTLTGELITWQQAHVDHALPVTFQYIADNFIEDFKLDYDIIEIDKENKFIPVFKDAELKSKFRKYHNQCCQLRVIKDKVNLSLKKKA
jgi:hypothetical protein